MNVYLICVKVEKLLFDWKEYNVKICDNGYKEKSDWCLFKLRIKVFF